MTSDGKPTGLGALAQRVIISNVKVQRAEAALEDLKEDLKAAKEAVHAALAEAGVDSVKYKGYTVYVHEQTFASLRSRKPEGDEDPKAAALEALRATGLNWMIKEGVSTQTLAAWVRELDVDEKTKMPKLPEGLVDHVKVSKKQDIRIKQS